MNQQITYLPIETLMHHPDNPRKDLGDLTELSESIKQNGVLQNLTVVRPDNDTDKDKFYVLIGNRRFEAAERAGLKELPCIIAEMDRKEQISTMLVENMQRSDLSVFEQAQGFQMMLDLGEDINTIVEKSGFSKSTVNRRIKLLELDQDKLREADERGCTLNDYIELDKIKNIEVKNKVLAAAGTSNFSWELKKAIENQEEQVNISKCKEKIKDFAEEISYEESKERKYKLCQTIYNVKERNIDVPTDSADRQYVYCMHKESWGLIIKIYKVLTDEEIQNSNEEIANKRSEAIEANIKKLNKLSNCAHEMRTEFALDVSDELAKKHFSEILAYLIKNVFIDCDYNPENLNEKLLKAFDINFNYLAPEDDDTDIDEDKIDINSISLRNIILAVQTQQYKSLWLIAYYISGIDEYEKYHITYVPCYNRSLYNKNSQLDLWYELLTIMGYKMSDEEKQYQNGTHSLFTLGLNDEGEDK